MRRQSIEKPWGGFEQFTLNETSTVKILKITQGEAFSLQTHSHRSEFWRVLKGHPSIQVGETIVEALPGDEFTIREGETHRISASTDNVEVLEIAMGNFDEKDITRLEDKYGRV